MPKAKYAKYPHWEGLQRSLASAQTIDEAIAALSAALIALHEAAADPHTVYRLKTTDHTHQSPGLQAGQLDHGLALTGLLDDDHTQYTLKSILSEKGDLYIASAAATPAALHHGNATQMLESAGHGADPLWSDVNGDNLGQLFGATAGRLANYMPVPEALSVVFFVACGRSPFSGRISGNPTATSVIYNNDINENMFALFYGSLSGICFGWPVLHNTTRGNSRRVTAWNKWSNAITTVSSADNWVNTDVITMQSQTNTSAGFFDIDLSAYLAASDIAAAVYLEASDVYNTGYSGFRNVIIHPFIAYNSALEVVAGIYADYGATSVVAIFPVYSRTITMKFGTGCVMINARLAVLGTIEYADT